MVHKIIKSKDNFLKIVCLSLHTKIELNCEKENVKTLKKIYFLQNNCFKLNNSILTLLHQLN
ncbi:hypothetical protein BpHYR1_054143 [Brachionus plicatilis]|uniref:Uncharacterized protein n=1 Tax=Brachionus plicatilis TaxID=10195 RepID=A0A3M7S978_BRAPC|nr:hypothetical protein BpHYR1_054143 [Brachionus plicatilis]